MSAPKSKRIALENQIARSPHETMSDKPSSLNRKRRRKEESDEEEFIEPPARKRIKFPTQNQHERSVVQIYSDFSLPIMIIPGEAQNQLLAQAPVLLFKIPLRGKIRHD